MMMRQSDHLHLPTDYCSPHRSSDSDCIEWRRDWSSNPHPSAALLLSNSFGRNDDHYGRYWRP